MGQSYKDFAPLAMDLVMGIYEATKRFPKRTLRTQQSVTQGSHFCSQEYRRRPG